MSTKSDVDLAMRPKSDDSRAERSLEKPVTSPRLRTDYKVPMGRCHIGRRLTDGG